MSLISQTGRSITKISSHRGPYYSVFRGKTPGIFSTWSECEKQVSGFSGAIFKKFVRREDAETFQLHGSLLPDTNKDNVLPKIQPLSETGILFDTFAPPVTHSKQEKNEMRVNRETMVCKTDILESKTPTVNQISGDAIQIYTDGACSGNGTSEAFAGIGVYFGDKDSRNVSERLPGEKQTNQRAELLAVIRALEIVRRDNPRTYPTLPIEIISDSKYVLENVYRSLSKWKRNGWRTVKNSDVLNRDLWERLSLLLTSNIRWKWVRGHSGVPGNEMADALATSALKRM